MTDERRPWWADDIRSAWKWLSVQLTALLAVVPQIYDMLPLVQEHLTTQQLHGVMSGLAVLTVIANLRNKSGADRGHD
mgnify:CR=1 FL=1